MAKLIFCEYHFKLFKDNGIDNVLQKSKSIEIKIRKYGKLRQTVCNKEHCIDKAKYVIEYE